MKKEIRVSIGSLGVLGIKDIKLPAPPTTLYFMVGEKCAFNCAYCPQSRDSHGSHEYLSRVIWPKTDWGTVEKAVSFAPKIVKRICFQVVSSPNFLEDTLFFIKEIKSVSELPVSVSVRLSDINDLRLLFNAGANRVGIALDVATEKTYADFRGGDFAEAVNFIKNAGKTFPGKITTHIIVGMGETDKELYETMKNFFENTITVGLFAFTPIKGTRLENRNPPSLKRYRRIQVMRNLFAQRKVFQPIFDKEENLTGLKAENAAELLKNPFNFVTSGCPHCNRPYYNETPTGPMFNYPFPPDKTDAVVEEFTEYVSESEIRFKI